MTERDESGSLICRACGLHKTVLVNDGDCMDCHEAEIKRLTGVERELMDAEDQIARHVAAWQELHDDIQNGKGPEHLGDVAKLAVEMGAKR